MSRLLRCEVCDGDPVWTLVRRGDVVTSWACEDDFSAVAQRLQRDWEITELVVTNHVKAAEWAQLGHTLNRIAEAGAP